MSKWNHYKIKELVISEIFWNDFWLQVIIDYIFKWVNWLFKEKKKSRKSVSLILPDSYFTHKNQFGIRNSNKEEQMRNFNHQPFKVFHLLVSLLLFSNFSSILFLFCFFLILIFFPSSNPSVLYWPSIFRVSLVHLQERKLLYSIS